ncbi:MAG: hypothetical protein LBV09_06715 [Deferribacteraceae bacterium]|jgi:hypothetical protein|nr:hypothetical protein [Deferribacteraceae bacterium]
MEQSANLREEFQASMAGKKNGTIHVSVENVKDLAPFEELFRLKKLFHRIKVL